jgi:hypothetical protein
MIKRTFVLFFCLVQFLALSLLAPQSRAFHESSVAVTSSVSEVNLQDDSTDCEDDCEDACDDNTPTIQADDQDYEWKENLSDLLRHRNSNYRFITFETVSSVYFQFTWVHRFFQKTVTSFAFFEAISTLPDYYSFLHRLCPF